MDMQPHQREFRYNGVKLPDPSPAFTLPQVRDFFANVYPEIVSADIEGPEQLGAKAVYTFRRAVGTKGSGALADMVLDLACLLHANWLPPGDAEFVKDMQELLDRREVTQVPAAAQERLLALHLAHCQAKAA